MISNFCTLMTSISVYQFGVLTFSLEYTKDSQEFISSKLAEYFTIAQLVQFLLAPLIGYLCDKMTKIWPISLLNSLVVIIALVGFIGSTPDLQNHFTVQDKVNPY